MQPKAIIAKITATATSTARSSSNLHQKEMLDKTRKTLESCIMDQDKLYHDLFTTICTLADDKEINELIKRTLDVTPLIAEEQKLRQKYSLNMCIADIEYMSIFLNSLEKKDETTFYKIPIFSLESFLFKILNNLPSKKDHPLRELSNSLDFYAQENTTEKYFCHSLIKDLRTHIIEDFIEMTTAFSEDNSDVFSIGYATGQALFDNIPTFLDAKFHPDKTISYYAIDPVLAKLENEEKFIRRANAFKINLKKHGDKRLLANNGSKINCILMPYHFVDASDNIANKAIFTAIQNIIKNKLANGKTVLLIDLMGAGGNATNTECMLYEIFKNHPNFMFCTRKMIQQKKYLLLQNSDDIYLPYITHLAPLVAFPPNRFPIDKGELSNPQDFIKCVQGQSLIEEKITKETINQLVEKTGIEKNKLITILQGIYTWDIRKFEIVTSKAALKIYDKDIITFKILSALSPKNIEIFINTFEEMNEHANKDPNKLKQNILKWAIELAIKQKSTLPEKKDIEINDGLCFFKELEVAYNYLLPTNLSRETANILLDSFLITDTFWKEFQEKIVNRLCEPVIEMQYAANSSNI